MTYTYVLYIYLWHTLMYYTYNYDIHATPGNVNICSIGNSMRTYSWFVKDSMTFRTYMTRNTYVDKKICSHGIPNIRGKFYANIFVVRQHIFDVCIWHLVRIRHETTRWRTTKYSMRTYSWFVNIYMSTYICQHIHGTRQDIHAISHVYLDEPRTCSHRISDRWNIGNSILTFNTRDMTHYPFVYVPF